MRKSVLALLLWISPSAFACTTIPMSWYFDTLETGAVRITRTAPDLLPPYDSVVTHSVPQEFRTRMVDMVRDSALVFVGRIDSMIAMDSSLRPFINLTFYNPPINPTYPSAYPYAYAMRLQIDSLIKGNLPRRTFWIEVRINGFNSCFNSPNLVASGAFLNFSSGLNRFSDLQLPDYQEADTRLPGAFWLSEGFIVSPEFPGLRDNFSAIMNESGVTAIHREPHDQLDPRQYEGKRYRLDGRAVPDAPNHKSPVLLLR